jgi:hypothetical protein
VSVHKRTNFNQARNAIFTIEPTRPDPIAPVGLKMRFFTKTAADLPTAHSSNPEQLTHHTNPTLAASGRF